MTTPRPAGQTKDTVQTVARKLTALSTDHDSTKGRVTSLEDKIAAQHNALFNPDAKDGLVRTKQGLTAAVSKAHGRIDNLDARVKELSETLGGRLDLVEQTIQAKGSGNKPVIAALEAAHCSREQIAQALMLLDDSQLDDMTQEDFLTEFFTAYVAFRDGVLKELERIDDCTVAAHTRADEAYTVATAASAAVDEVRDEMSEISVSSSPSKGALVLALVLGIIAALLWGRHNFHEVVAFNIGNQFGSGDMKYRVLNSWIAATLFGVVVFGLVMVLASLGSKTTTNFRRRDRSQSSASASAVSARHYAPAPSTQAPTTIVAAQQTAPPAPAPQPQPVP